MGSVGAKGAGGKGTAQGRDREADVIRQLITDAENGEIAVDVDDYNDIVNTNYGIKTADLSPSDREALRIIVANSITVPQLADTEAKNTWSNVDAIGAGKVAQINISQFSTKNLKDFITITSKVGTVASVTAVHDALKLLSWYNQ